MRSFSDEDTEFEIERSDTPVDVDGYKLDEPKRLECPECGAGVLLTPDPSPGVDELQHHPQCDQRWVRSEWWAEHFTQE